MYINYILKPRRGDERKHLGTPQPVTRQVRYIVIFVSNYCKGNKLFPIFCKILREFIHRLSRIS